MANGNQPRRNGAEGSAGAGGRRCRLRRAAAAGCTVRGRTADLSPPSGDRPEHHGWTNLCPWTDRDDRPHGRRRGAARARRLDPAAPRRSRTDAPREGGGRPLGGSGEGRSEALLPRGVGGPRDHRSHPRRARGRTLDGCLRQEAGLRRQATQRRAGRVRRRLPRGDPELPTIPRAACRAGRTTRGRRHRACHARWQRHGGPHRADPDRAAGRGGRDRLDAAPDHCLRRDEDPQGEGGTPRGAADARAAVAGTPAAVSNG